MAREAVIVELLGDRGDVIRYACNDSDAIAKGQLCCVDTVTERKLSGANLIGVPAGIAASEKVASDGQLFLGVYTNGIFDLAYNAVGGGAAIGEQMVISGSNYVNAATNAQIQSGMVLGKLMGVPTGGDIVTVKVKL